MTEPLVMGNKCCFDEMQKVMLLKAQEKHVADPKRPPRNLKLLQLYCYYYYNYYYYYYNYYCNYE